MLGVFDFAYKVLRIFKTHGIRGVKAAVDSSYGNADIVNSYRWIVDDDVIELDEKQKKENEGRITLNWILPDFDIGSGGPVTIMRFVSNLEDLGFHNRIYIFGGKRFDDDKSFREILSKHYSKVLTNPNVEAYSDVKAIKYATATIATGWQTAYFVKRFNNTDKKFYFIQDFEPGFYPMGSEYLWAEDTYSFGFVGITAGDWLKDKLREEYGMKTESFHFAVDNNVYKHRKKEDDQKRIFFYARPTTKRRAFEMGLLALNEICKRDKSIEVVFAGWDIGNYIIPFKHKNEGIVSEERLSYLYSQCDICMLMSTTNLSLLPLEIMASGSVVATNRGENNAWLLDEGNAILYGNKPSEIADTILRYINDPVLLEEKRRRGAETVEDVDWRKEAEKVYRYMVENLVE